MTRPASSTASPATEPPAPSLRGPGTLWPLGLVTAVFLGAVLWAGRARILEGKASLIDLGVVEQALWSFAHLGVPLHSIETGGAVMTWLGLHFSPLVLIFAPLYWLEMPAFGLQVIQALAVASATIPIYLASRRLGLGTGLAQSLAALALIHPFTLNGAVWDFHEVALATPVIGWALYGLAARRFGLVCAMAALLLLLKEHYGLAVAGLGVAWGLHTKEWKRGGGLAAAGLAGLAGVVLVAMPAFAPQGGHMMISGGVEGASSGGMGRYGWLETDPATALRLLLFGVLATPQSALYLGLIALSFWRLSPMGWVFLLIAIADLAAAMASLNPMPRLPTAYHPMPMVPAMAIAAAAGLARFADPGERRRQLAMAAILVAAASWAFSPFPLPGAANPWELTTAGAGGPAAALTVPEAAARIEARLPRKAALSVPPDLGAVMARRPRIMPFPRAWREADAVALRLAWPYSDFSVQPFSNPYGPEPYFAAVSALQTAPGWRLAWYESGHALWRRAAAAPDAAPRDAAEIRRRRAFARDLADFRARNETTGETTREETAGETAAGARDTRP